MISSHEHTLISFQFFWHNILSWQFFLIWHACTYSFGLSCPQEIKNSRWTGKSVHENCMPLIKITRQYSLKQSNDLLVLLTFTSIHFSVQNITCLRVTHCQQLDTILIRFVLYLDMENYSSPKSTYTFIIGKILIRGKWCGEMSQQMIHEGPDLVCRVMAEFISGNVRCIVIDIQTDSITVNKFLDITDPENWVEMKLLVDQ